MARGTAKSDMFTFLRDMNMTLTDEKPMSGSAYARAKAEMTTKQKVELPKINDMIERLVPKTGDKDGYRGFFSTASAAINKLAILRQVHGSAAYDAIAKQQLAALAKLKNDVAEDLIGNVPDIHWRADATTDENRPLSKAESSSPAEVKAFYLNHIATRIDTLSKIMIGAAPGNAIDTVRQLASHANEFTPDKRDTSNSYRYGRLLGRAMQRMADDIETNLKRIYTIPNG